MIDNETYKRKNLLALPERRWNEETIYDSILIVPTGRKHDSGYALIAIVGTINYRPAEIAAYCDDINWITPESTTVGSSTYPFQYQIADFHSDMFYPSNILQMWSRNGKFKVGYSSSSTDITFIKDKK
jgi:hypothetical protein